MMLCHVLSSDGSALDSELLQHCDCAKIWSVFTIWLLFCDMTLSVLIKTITGFCAKVWHSKVMQLPGEQHISLTIYSDSKRSNEKSMYKCTKCINTVYIYIYIMVLYNSVKLMLFGSYMYELLRKMHTYKKKWNHDIYIYIYDKL